MRLLVALAAGLLVGSADPAPGLGEVAQPQMIPPGSRWSWKDADGMEGVEEFGRSGVWRYVCPDDGTWETSPFKYTLNATASPPRIDWTCPGTHVRGIYRMDGDRLLICLARRVGGPRPTSSADRPKVGQHLYVYRRLK
jgi:uncharacterized protein (TIGR03067 family)